MKMSVDRFSDHHHAQEVVNSPGGPMIRTSHLKMSLSSSKPAEKPVNKEEVEKFMRLGKLGRKIDK